MASQISRLIQRELTVHKPHANGLNLGGIFPFARYEGDAAWDQHAGQIATGCQRHHHGREPFVTRRHTQNAAARRKRSDETAKNNSGVVTIREAVEHRRRPLRAAITWVRTDRGKRDGAGALELAGGGLHQQADFPVPGVITQGDRSPVRRTNAAVRRQNQEFPSRQR